MSQILKQSVGIDISKDKFDACFSVIDHQHKVTVKATRKFSNSKAGFKAFDEWVNRKAALEVSLVFVLEATGSTTSNWLGISLSSKPSYRWYCPVRPNTTLRA